MAEMWDGREGRLGASDYTSYINSTRKLALVSTALVGHCAAHSAPETRRGTARYSEVGEVGEKSSGTHPAELYPGKKGVDGLPALGIFVGLNARWIGRGGERAG
ncbi:hypothetical protein FRC12_022551, partial [Ceratobasidium sp. 428]